MATVLACIIIAGIIAFVAAAQNQAGGSSAVPDEEIITIHEYRRAEYSPVARSNAQTLTYMFGGFGILAFIIIVLAVIGRTRESSDE